MARSAAPRVRVRAASCVRRLRCNSLGGLVVCIAPCCLLGRGRCVSARSRTARVGIPDRKLRRKSTPLFATPLLTRTSSSRAPYLLVCVHLSLAPACARSSACLLSRSLQRSSSPLLLAGFPRCRSLLSCPLLILSVCACVCVCARAYACACACACLRFYRGACPTLYRSR